MAEREDNQKRSVEEIEKDYLRCLVGQRLLALSAQVAQHKLPSYEDMQAEAQRIINLVNEYRG